MTALHTASTSDSLHVSGEVSDLHRREVLTPEATAFIALLNRKFNGRRIELLAARHLRQKDFDAGARPDFLAATKAQRASDWQVAPAPADLADRRVEITGPVEAKMMINALNSGARAFMADIEDSLSPTWTNVLDGQVNLKQAVRRTLTYTNEAGKDYRLNAATATLLVRPRGWHLPEKHVTIAGQPVSASLFDFGLYFFHNAKEALARGTGPYFYLPKLESHLEARLWNDVFLFAQEQLGIPRGTIKATVLIETITAAFEMDEILYELRDHITGLNAGRWDYIFSCIKKFSSAKDCVFPDRAHVTMAVPFMQAYCDLLVQTCHRRGAHAMGGMAAFIPSRRDAEVNRIAMAKVREDKEREARLGFDGTWVAHPDLVALATEVFDAKLGSKPNQKDVQRPEVNVAATDLITFKIPGAKVTEAGLASNIDVALQYLSQWLNGTGAAAIHNLMEDAATAEISRSQLWQWLHQGVKLDDGRPVTADLYRMWRAREFDKLAATGQLPCLDQATELLDGLVLSPQCADFLTLPERAKGARPWTTGPPRNRART